MQTTCGVLVTNGTHLLICHPTGGSRWDIPKGKQDPGEDDITTAVRETWEETGLRIDTKSLTHLGTWPYKSTKKLSVFLHIVDMMPNPRDLVCYSHFELEGRSIPEMDDYEIATYAEALEKVNPDMRRVLEPLLNKQKR